MRHMRGSALFATGAIAFFAACSETTSPTSSTVDADADQQRVEREGSDGTPAAGGAQAAGGQVPARRVYEVTIENLTSAQPLTPPLAATHNGSFNFFDVGKAATFGIQEIAENGNLAPLHTEISTHKQVSDVIIAASPGPGPLMPGTSITFTIEADPGAPFVSFAAMLICTNDGFTGLDSDKLPRMVGQRTATALAAYDAGTEINTESFVDIVPPCPVLTGVPSSVPGTGMSDPALAENGVIHHHQGIAGGADLDPQVHGWTNPVALITIERVG